MALDPKEWRPITFQGVSFPATLMASDVLEPILGFEHEELGAWLWRLTICRGVTKREPSETCVRCAERLLDLMLEQRQLVLDGIQDRLGSHGFDAKETYRDWIMAFQQIIQLSKATDGDCSWSAPEHPDDPYKGPDGAERFLKALERSHQLHRRKPKPDK
jgi:hypothetical protein